MRSATGTAAHRRWAARARSTATATSAAVAVGRVASGAPVIGVCVVSGSPEATTRAVRARTRAGSTAYVARGSVSGSAMTSGITRG